MPTLKIDGREITVERGTTILDAARELGIEIPTFCYHPGLSSPANCRMCLVELSVRGRMAPKPQPACYSQVADEMEVWTQSEHIETTRKSVLEFILLNHPVDCPICDQAGECVLQDHYFKYSRKPSRLDHKKVHKAKAKPLGPDIVLDAERCILCTRCVRFCDEVAGESQLEIMNRGEHSEITTFPGQQLDNPYAGNVVDICPVGALTSNDFRFRTRVWFMQSAESVCPECARSCRIRVDTFDNVARRYKPLQNPDVNSYWMCDDGRRSVSRWFEDRMEGPAAPVDGKRRVLAVTEAVEAAAALLGDASPGSRGVLLSPWLTNEDAFLAAKLLAGPLAGARVFVGGRAAGAGDDILRRPDANPNSAGLQRMLETFGVAAQALSALDTSGLDVLLVLGDDHALDDDALGKLDAVGSIIAAGVFQAPLWKLATVWLPARIPLEKVGTYTNFEGVVQRLDQVVKPVGTCKSEGWYALQLAELLGASLGDVRGPEAVFGAIAAEVPGFAGMTYDALRPHGLKLGSGARPEAAAPPPPPPPGA